MVGGEKILYEEYREEIEGEPLAKALRTGSFVLFVIQTVFILVDLLFFPESFSRFLPVRLALNLVLAFVYFHGSYRFPLISTFVGILAGGGMLLAVTQGTGGATSGYYVGLVLLFVGIGALIPVSGSQASWMISLLSGAYVGLPLLSEGPIPWNPFALHLFFLGAAGFAGAMSCALLDRMRFSEFKHRREIERARDELRALDSAKSRFTANVHHELRTPLTLILAPLDALRSGEFGSVPEGTDRILKTMHSNGLRLLKLINNLLDLARLESRQFEIRRRPVDLSSLVVEVVEGARPLAERKGVALSMGGFEAPAGLCADPDALEKVLVNLIGNALKFTDSGGSISVGAEAVADGVQLEVVDTGIGIPADQVERIFDRFAQVDGSATREHEGTGIGLSLARELVELHGGRIWAESAGRGYGTAVRLLLPLGEADAVQDEEVLQDGEGRALDLSRSMGAAEAELGLGGEPSGEPDLVDLEHTVERWEGTRQGEAPAAGGPAQPPDAPDILVAEDNPEMRGLLAMLLAKEFRVRTAANGRAALEAVRERAPYLVLTDVMMPEMSGSELCQAIKDDPATRHIPVVLVTSKAEREMKIEGLEQGADDYVTKPFHPRELLARVRSLVRLRGLQEELAQRNASLEQALRDLKQTEVQLVRQERLAAVGELAAGVAHEVNNPVNFALNAVRTLQSSIEELARVAERTGELDWSDRAKLEAQVRELRELQDEIGMGELADTIGELVQIVSEGLDRTSRLVGDLRDFAAPGREVQARVDLRRGLVSTVQLLRHALKEAGASVDLQVPGDFPCVQGDSAALNQVFLNLLKNAAEALSEAGGSICVVGTVETEFVRLDFEDDGPGIEPELRERLFEPFFTTKEAGRGSGLGLSISRQIAEAHDGSLELNASSERGSCFTLRLALGGRGPGEGDGAP
jgi:signal transduction histidine kinase